MLQYGSSAVLRRIAEVVYDSKPLFDSWFAPTSHVRSYGRRAPGAELRKPGMTIPIYRDPLGGGAGVLQSPGSNLPKSGEIEPNVPNFGTECTNIG